MRCRGLSSAETLFVPHAWNAVEGVYLVAAVKEADLLHFGRAAGIGELFFLKLVVILPSLQKALQEGEVRNANFGAHFKLRLIYAFCFTHAAPLSLDRASIVPIPERLRQPFPHWEGIFLQVGASRERAYRERSHARWEHPESRRHLRTPSRQSRRRCRRCACPRGRQANDSFFSLKQGWFRDRAATACEGRSPRLQYPLSPVYRRLRE